MLPQNTNCPLRYLPGKFSHPHGGKYQQFLIICLFLQSEQTKIEKNLQMLSSTDPGLFNNWQLIKEWLSKQKCRQQFYEKYKNCVYSIASLYNQKVRLRLSLEELRLMQEGEESGVLPPPSPCQYVDTTTWTTSDQQTNQKNWIGHGYYWKSGDGLTKDNYSGDYNTLEENFYRMPGAKVLLADYDLLRNDFQNLRHQDESSIDQWLLAQTAYLSEGQLSRISPGGDLHSQLEIDQAALQYFVDRSKSKPGLRYRGGGRAVNFIVDDQYRVISGKFEAKCINVKGVGSEKIISGFGVKENGLLSLVDAIKEYSYQKLLQKLSQLEHQEWHTVQTYAIIDIGLRYRKDVQSPATGYRGDRLGLTIRQACSRFESAPDEACYYSVVPYELQGQGNPINLIRTLVKWGVSSEQQPLSLLRQPFNIDDLSGSWNIQSDGSLSRFVDFSQFYVLPNSKLPPCWRISESAFLEGVQANKFAFSYLLEDKSLMQKYLGVDEEQQAKEKYQQDLEKLKSKYGSTVGKMRKPSLSWSWFLEVDDSEVQRFALKHGLGQDQLGLNPTLFRDQLCKWLNF